MAGASLLTLLDDIATVLDDVAVMSKVAVKKTAGVLGDDLALNAQQVAGVKAEREIPVVWAVAKGSFINKCILVPSALAISVYLPWLILPLLMMGGAYLCFEGFEKVFHKVFHKEDAKQQENKVRQALQDPKIDMVQFEKDKIRGAIRTDFILSAEIIVIALGTVSESPFVTQASVVTAIALGMTIFVYGLVAMIVKLDDFGLYLSEKSSDFMQKLGGGLLSFAPILMKTLTIVGTLAMFLVGGHIIIQGIPYLHHIELSLENWFDFSAVVLWFAPIIYSAIIGLSTGGIIVALLGVIKKILSKEKAQAI